MPKKLADCKKDTKHIYNKWASCISSARLTNCSFSLISKKEVVRNIEVPVCMR